MPVRANIELVNSSSAPATTTKTTTTTTTSSTINDNVVDDRRNRTIINKMAKRRKKKVAPSPEKDTTRKEAAPTLVVLNQNQGNSEQMQETTTGSATAAPIVATTGTAPAMTTTSNNINKETPQTQEATAAALPSSREDGNAAALARLHRNHVPLGDEDHQDNDDDDDDDDDDAEDSSSLGYSDDSASLSDAYFHPQPGDDLALPGGAARFRGSFPDVLALHHPHSAFLPSSSGGGGIGGGIGAPQQHYHPSATSPLSFASSQHHHYPGGASYGSTLPFSHYSGNNYYSASSASSAPSLWTLGGPIQEDYEETAATLPFSYHASQFPTTHDGNHVGGQQQQQPQADGSSPSVVSSSSASGSLWSVSESPGRFMLTKRERRKQRRLMRQHHQWQLQQREAQLARERAVTVVRGRPQKVTQWQDFIWAVLFLAQLTLVLLCALRFGGPVLLVPLPDGKATGGGGGGGSSAVSLKKPTARGLLSLRGSALEANINRALWLDKESISSTSTLDNLMFKDDPLSTPYWTRPPLSEPRAATDDDIANTMDSFSSSSTTSSSSKKTHAFTIDYKNVLALTFFTGFFACILSYISFGFMLILASSLIQIMLIFSIIVTLAWGLVGLTLDPYGIISILGFAALLLTLGYTMFSWHRVSFAATNLHTALCALRCTADITILGVISLAVASLWCVLWSVALIGVVNWLNHTECEKNNEQNCDPHVNQHHIPLYLLLLFSFYWTNMVIRNVVRATVSSAVGVWWFQPQKVGPFCTAAVIGPLFRSLTKSLGSICFAALIVQPAEIIVFFGNLCAYFCCGDGPSCRGGEGDGDGNERRMQRLPSGGDDNLVGPRKKIPLKKSLNRKHFPGDSVEGSGTSDDDVVGSTTSGASKNKGDSQDAKKEEERDDADAVSGNGGIVRGTENERVVHDNKNKVDSPADTVGLCRRCCGIMPPCYQFLRSCNRWSVTYIGMYGYSFAEAGEKAIQLFETRQWMEVVEDSIIQNVLMMASVVIGGCAGVFAVVVEETDGYDFSSFHEPILTAFMIGFVLGYVLSNTLLLGVVGSAFNTILVCFAAGPFEFDKNHPRLSREMRGAWTQVWEPSV